MVWVLCLQKAWYRWLQQLQLGPCLQEPGKSATVFHTIIFRCSQGVWDVWCGHEDQRAECSSQPRLWEGSRASSPVPYSQENERQMVSFPHELWELIINTNSYLVRSDSALTMLYSCPVDRERQTLLFTRLTIAHIFQNQHFCTTAFPLEDKALAPSGQQNTGPFWAPAPSTMVVTARFWLLL